MLFKKKVNHMFPKESLFKVSGFVSTSGRSEMAEVVGSCPGEEGSENEIQPKDRLFLTLEMTCWEYISP